MPTTRKAITFSMPPEMAEQVQQVVKEEGRTMSECQGRSENVPEQCGRRREKALANCTTHRLPSSHKELDGGCEGCTKWICTCGSAEHVWSRA